MSGPGGGGPTNRGDERGWSLAARAAGAGVRLELAMPDRDGVPITAVLMLERAEARAFARALLAAAGDATERTFQSPRDS